MKGTQGIVTRFRLDKLDQGKIQKFMQQYNLLCMTVVSILAETDNGHVEPAQAGSPPPNMLRPANREAELVQLNPYIHYYERLFLMMMTE